jgi:GAF domain-containing protein
VDNRCIGVLSLYTGKKHKFSEEEIVFIKALAGNGGMTLKKARLLERIEKNTALFLELASAINSSLDIRQVLHNMSEKTCKALGMKGVTIRLLDEDRNALDMVSSYGLSDEFLSKGTVSAEKSITEALKGKTIVMEDTATDKRLQYPLETEKEGIRSMVCVPIRSREKVIGVMRLYSCNPRKYPQDFINVVEALAHTGALAIQNASMYLQLMDQFQSFKQMMQMSKMAFDNSYIMMMSAYEQNKLMVNTFLNQTTDVPAEGKKAIEDWLQAYRKGCEELKKMTDEGYRMVEKQMSAADK